MKKSVALLILSTLLPAFVFAADTSGRADVDVDAGVEIEETVSAGLDTEVEASGASEENASGGADVSIEIPGELGIVVVTRADIAEGSEQTSIAPSEVRSEADLSGFVAAEISADEKISKIETSSQEVSVTYDQRAKLFWIIPIMVKATAIVAADGSVDVSYPWYAFVLATNEANLEADISNRIGAAATSAFAAAADAEAGFAAATQAEIISEVRAAMEASLAADASANSSVAL